MLRVEFNASEARAALGRAKAALGDLTPLHRDLKEYMIEATRKRFSSGVAPDGSRWAPKARSTIEHYERLGYGGMAKTRTLYLIGRLSREIVGQAGKDGAVIGSNLIYAAVMQEGAAKGAFGTDRRGRPLPWGNIPARRWLGLSPKDEAEIVAIAEEHMGSAIGREG